MEAAHSAALDAVAVAFASPAAATATGVPRAGTGPFTITGGIEASSATAKDGDYFYDASELTLHILTSTPLTISTAAQTTSNIEVNAGVKADLTLAGVKIVTPGDGLRAPINLVNNVMDTADHTRATHADQIINKTMLHLTLADNSENHLECLANDRPNATTHITGAPGIRCGWGSVLVIDDSVRNLTKDNKIVEPVNGLIGADTTLSNGTMLAKGSPLSQMDSPEAGSLYVKGGNNASAIGGGPKENSGKLIFNGGNLEVQACTTKIGDNYSPATGAAIGGGNGGSGTTIIFNGGNVVANASYHGAAIGSGWGWWNPGAIEKEDAIGCPTFSSVPAYGAYDGYRFWNTGTGQYDTVAGDIYINGGYVEANGAEHGNGFGTACLYTTSTNRNHIIRVTGGTLLPTSTSINYDMGGKEGYVIVTGGSVYTREGKFQGIGDTAYNTLDVTDWDDVLNNHGGALPDSDKVFMITIDLASEITKRNNESGITNDTELDDRINSWELTVGGNVYPYGSPDRFQTGKLYLWLPKSATEKEITVTLTYTDKKGDVQTIEPLFRAPGTDQGGDTLKRYIDFELPQDYLEKLHKYYNGEPFETLDIENQNPPLTGLVTNSAGDRVSDGKELNNPDYVTYKYLQYDKVNGTPIGVESSSVKTMPADVGVMKFTMDSTQWSGDANFSASYWGHRATGWCEIKPIDSKVTLVEANWPDNKPGHEQDSAHKLLTIHATIDKADRDPDGNPTGAACKAPRGFVQLFVDGQAVGGPVKLVFQGDLDEEGNEIKAGDERINAREVARGEGSYTDFTYAFTPSSQDFLLPDATKDNRHIVSLQYIHPVNDDRDSALYSTEPANYLDSVNPAEDPEAAPKAEIAIEPVDPTTDVALGDDPEADPDAPEDPDAPKPTVTTNGAPTPADPNDPDSTRTFGGTISTVYDIPSEENPHPGRVTLNVKTSSSGPVSVTGEDGEVFEADFVRGDDGEPVRNPDGTYTLVLDPTAVGKGKLTFKQEPNGAHTGTTWSYDVDIQPNPKIRPQASVAKRAENLTHPGGPTQPGDRIRYTVTASNAAKGSAWTDVTLSDRLPAALELDEASVRLASKSERFDGALKKAAAPTSVGTFALTGPDADGRVTLSALAGSVYGGSEAVLSFECTVAGDAVGADLANIAEAQGSRPDPDNPGGELPENPGPSDPALPEGGGKVAPADPEAKTSKSVENTTAPDAKVTRVGDVLRYTVALANEGPAGSCLVGAAISDPLPKGIEPVAGSIKMTLPDGTERAVDDSAYDRGSRTLAVTAGDLWGGQSVALTFECTVGEGVLGADNANIARVHGKVPSENPGDGSQPADPEPGEPADPAAGGLVDQTPPASPKTLVGNDPADGDLSVEKEAANLTRDDGATRVGDTVRYTVRLANSGAATSWMNAVLRDEMPKGVEPLAGTIKVTLPDGTEKGVDDAAYDEKARVLSVSAGQLYGGQEVVLAFDALVTEAALGADIGNVAVALGVPPSRWDPDSEHPEAGEPYSPPAGWEALELETEKISSNVAYPPGTDAKNGPLPAEGDGNGAAAGKKVDDSKTIAKTRLAQTGDDARAVAALGTLAVLAAAALTLATRRRARSK